MNVIDANYYYAIAAGVMGCSAFYLVLPIKIKFSTRINHLVVSVFLGAIAFAVSHNYYPSKDEIINYAVYPFAAGFCSPLTQGLSVVIYQFSQNPYIVIERISGAYAKIITAIRGKGN